MDPTLVERMLTAGSEALTVALLMLAFLALRKWRISAERARLISAAVDLVYGAVNEMARRTENRIDDKAALAIKKLAEYLASQGADPLTSEEVAQARLTFTAKHGTESKLLDALAAASPS